MLFGAVVLCAGVAIGANTDRSVRRHGVPPDGGSLIADKPRVPTGISARPRKVLDGTLTPFF